LVAEICDAAQGVCDDLKYEPEYEPLVDNMWANISPRHAFNRMHIHPRVIWSGVYYLQTPRDSGLIHFTDPRVQSLMLCPVIDGEGLKEAHNWTEVYFEPIKRRLILFPAWLSHEVEPNLSEEEGDAGNRISISFNLLQQRKRTSET
jgi:uncharacterized protein (TIGR02466 family)